jgi:hypothetical protein
MAKEMSHDFTDGVTDDVASKVLTTKRPVTPTATIRERSSKDEAPLKSGVGKIDVGAHASNQPPRPMPIPPRVRARVPAPAAPEPPSPEPDSDVHSSEKTQVYRPNLSDAQVRPSVRPTVRPQVATAPVAMPKPPKVPVGIPGARNPERRSTAATPISNTAPEQEDCTRVCPAAVIEGLLKKEDTAARDAFQSAADEVTRVGEIPIEERILAERQVSPLVGHEDVTRSYSFNVNDTPSQVTAPGKRQLIRDLKQEPLVIIQPDRARRKLPVGLIGLLVLAILAGLVGWKYRSTVSRHAQSLQASFLRGIGAVAKQQTPPRHTPVRLPMVNLSINVSPAEAVLTVDGARVPNPFMAQKRSDQISHQLAVEAPGYVPLKREVRFDRDLTVFLALAPMPASTGDNTKAALAEAPASPITSPAATPSPRVRTQKALPKPPQAKAEGASIDCRVPYAIDAAGIKTYRPECL